MKRLFTMLLILSVTIPLFGCAKDTPPLVAEIDSANYNNLYNPFTDICADGDTVFYGSDGFYNMRMFVHENQTSTKLFEEHDFSGESMWYRFWTIDRSVYFDTRSTETEERHIYRYDIATQTHTKLLTADQLHDWMTTGDHIAYEISTSDDNGDNYRCDLYVYSIDQQESTFVCEDVWNFGIVNGSLRYLYVTDDDKLGYFQYDFDTQESKLLFTMGTSLHTCYNYTDDYLIAFEPYDSAEITVYSMDGNSTVYTMPRTIQRFVAGDQYAYAVCYHTEEYSSTHTRHPDNDIYKINLSDGKYEALDCSVNSDTDIYVVSDDLIYILQGKMNLIGMYSTQVYLYTPSTDTKTKVFKY